MNVQKRFSFISVCNYFITNSNDTLMYITQRVGYLRKVRKFRIVFTLILWVLSNFNSLAQTGEANLTEEEKAWVLEHPVLKTTSKNVAAPIEFIRAGEAAGFSVDYLNLVAEKTGLKIDYVTGISWLESLKLLENHEIDISHNIIEGAGRDKFLNFTDPYFKLDLVLFSQINAASVRRLQDLEGKTIAVLRNLAIARNFKEMYPDFIFLEVDTSTEALLAISEGNADFYVSPRSIGNYIISNNFIRNVKVVGSADFLNIVNSENSRIAARNDWPELITILKKGMAAISETQLKELSQRWLMTEKDSQNIGLSVEELRWLSENSIIRVAVDPSIMPVESISQAGEIVGISGSYLSILADKLDVTFEWSGNETFSDAIDQVQAKEVDMLSAISPTTERESYLKFTDTYMNLNSVIFAREGETLFGDLEGLNGYAVAQAQGHIVTGWLKRDYPEIEIVETPSISDALKLVSAGVVDAHVGSVPITSYNIASESLTNLAVVGVTPYEGGVAMGIRDDLPHFASAMQKAFSSITETEKAEITRGWLTLNITTEQNYDLVRNIMLAAGAILLIFLIWNYSLRREVSRRKFSEERFRQIAENVDGVFFICSYNLEDIKYVSPNFEKWTGLNGQKFCDDSSLWNEFVHPDDRELFKASIATVVKSKYKTPIPDYRFVGPDGTIKWLSTQGHPIVDENGQTDTVIGFVSDVTESVKSRAQLVEISNQFQNAFHHASQGIALLGLNGEFLRVNEALCNILDHSKNDLLLLNISDISYVEDLEISRLLMSEIVSGRRLSFQIETRYIRQDKSSVPVQLNVSMVSDNKDNPVHFVAQIQDLSELKERDEQLRHSQKMDAVGQLTGGIAHDFNNILGIILGNLEILKGIIPAEEKTTGRLNKAISGVDRGTNLIKKLLSFSRRRPRKEEIININNHIVNLNDFITRSLTVSIKVKTNLADSLWPVEIDAGDLQDAILNIALNARDAMDGGGELLIKTKNVMLDEDYLKLNPDANIGEHVMLSISDTGEGIDAKIQEKILEPFFTTKPINKGTGLGLSMVHGFVQRSNGHLKISSELGLGTTFEMFIPKSDKVIVQNEMIVESRSDLPKGNETILIVEDEKHLCEVAQTQLTELGYSVYTANNASYALDILSKNADIDLLFSDIVMPDSSDGYKMASSALKLQPTLRVLLTSGFTQNLEETINDNDAFLAEVSQNMLQKPYNQHELAVAIRRSLDAS